DGYIITNPPYGVRTDKENLNDLYKLIGDTFKHHFNGFSCWVISSDKDAVDSIGLHASSKRKLFNGPLECRFLGYRMY
ncbi:MAG: RNA methyltransferase, partial [Bacteroidales bacterium]|nr:RNA methyltransferase [Bacteroidales bacterium]